eukprot:CAMPEP_0116859706 /NCGR_PEP_ID=MMETSP0418-20121206/21982_1 /TAXON_ID=1158023 /ORGANISM="Astrosyne radiata, Strain 13vi08-1A" /LENGTH=1112 /DNA_ID=CAMNT_0004493979 /DNA_START=353 /DNA_END=3691 /DNA_ORIENTATION=+
MAGKRTRAGSKAKKEVESHCVEGGDEGVLLHLRVLKEHQKTIQGKSIRALFLGRVVSYRSEHNARGSKLSGGRYTVKFDFSGIKPEELGPDEVVACANLFYQQQQSRALAANNRMEQLPVLSDFNGSIESSAKGGRRMLAAHNNWPLEVSDLEKLDVEREAFAAVVRSEGREHPPRVEPTWFGVAAAQTVPPTHGVTEVQHRHNDTKTKTEKPVLQQASSPVTFKESNNALGTLASISASLASQGEGAQPQEQSCNPKPQLPRPLSHEAAALWKSQAKPQIASPFGESHVDNIMRSPSSIQTKLALSGRGTSDNNSTSASSIHCAGTPKSGNIPGFGTLRTNDQDKTMSMPLQLSDLRGDMRERHEGSNDSILKPDLSRSASRGKRGGAAHLDEASAAGHKRGAGTHMEPLRVLKRQRSQSHSSDAGAKYRRPSPVTARKTSYGSRFSLTEDLDISFGSHRAPLALRKGDRQFSVDSYNSIPMPSVIRATDRNFSTDSQTSLISFDSGHSRLTLSGVGNAALSPHDTSKVAGIDDLYTQLDRYMESPISKSPAAYFTSRPMKPIPVKLEDRKEGTEQKASGGFQGSPAGARRSDSVPGQGATAVPEAGQAPTSGNVLQRVSFQNDSCGTQTKAPKAGEIPNRPSHQLPHMRMQSEPTNVRMPVEPSMNMRIQSEPTVRPPAPRGMEEQFGYQQRPAMLPESMQQWLSGSPPESTIPDPMGQPGGQVRVQRMFAPSFDADPHQARFGATPGIYSGHGFPRPPGYGHPMPPYGSGHSYPAAFDGMLAKPIDGRNGPIPTGPKSHSSPTKGKTVEFGHPCSKVLEGKQLHSRHSLMMCGAHKSDISPVNGTVGDGCDSLLVMDPVVGKDDLEVVKFKCSPKNGGAALLSNFKRNLPIRIFRKTKSNDGVVGFRYDGLYSPSRMSDESAKLQTQKASSPKVLCFEFRRNPAGPKPTSNRVSLEDLWGMISQGKDDSSNFGVTQPPYDKGIPHVTKSANPSFGNMPHMEPDPSVHFKAPPPGLSHPPNIHYGPRPVSHDSNMHYRGPSSYGPPRGHLERQTSAEVSLLRIRYFDDPNRPPTGGHEPVGMHPSIPPSMAHPMPPSVPPHHSVYGHPRM